MEIKLLKPKELTSETQDQLMGLLDQISPGKIPLMTMKLFDQQNPLTLVYCLLEGQVVGMASMCTYKVHSGYKGWIEDVVVDHRARGRGIGRKLMEKLIEVSREKGLSRLLLFTEDHRKAAVHLYKDLGFQFKDSQIYQIRMDQQ
ncbi:GNAT family N-acetyltransferase [Poritiphilus flavus]|uniref:GNAT family N-acetyltransferase n=1 Tax=Poritiphilus flavus TaxID=2697053 RepID=A0A6L9E8C2_9FLAO|nr:GNAT family N-acetyltransferase [Poritiphilus flavus]NAS10709.1 GNAT family N-acetyltransferase [Poritiphilus flavus]